MNTGGMVWAVAAGLNAGWACYGLLSNGKAWAIAVNVGVAVWCAIVALVEGER